MSAAMKLILLYLNNSNLLEFTFVGIRAREMEVKLPAEKGGRREIFFKLKAQQQQQQQCQWSPPDMSGK